MRFRRSALLPILAALVILAACGGDNETATTDTTRAPATTDGTIGDLPAPTPGEFEEYPEGKIRFANYWRADGAGSPVDIYWGGSAQIGEKMATVEYGTVTDWETMKIEANPLGGNGSPELRVTIQRPGQTDFNGVLNTLSETLEGGERLTVILGGTNGSDGLQSTTVYEHQVGTPSEGQGLLLLNSTGLGGVEGGDFVSLDPAGTCRQEWEIDNTIDNGNAGTAYTVPAGSLQVIAHDANVSPEECAAATIGPIPVEVAAGDRYLVVVWGTTKADRRIEAFKIES
jgi:hypothetical protein